MKKNIFFFLILSFVHYHYLQSMHNIANDRIEIISNDNGYKKATYDIFRNFFQKKTHTFIRRTIITSNAQAYTLVCNHIIIQTSYGDWAIYDSKNNEWRAQRIYKIFAHKNRYICAQFGINNWSIFDCQENQWVMQYEKELHFVGSNYLRVRHHDNRWSLFNLEKNCIVIHNATQLYFSYDKYVWIEDFDRLWYLFSLKKNEWPACHAQKIYDGNGCIIVEYSDSEFAQFPIL